MHRCFGLASNKSCQTNASVFEDLGIKTPKSTVVAVNLVQFIFFIFFCQTNFPHFISFIAPHTQIWLRSWCDPTHKMVSGCSWCLRNDWKMWVTDPRFGTNVGQQRKKFRGLFLRPHPSSNVTFCTPVQSFVIASNTFVHSWTFKHLGKYSKTPQWKTVVVTMQLSIGWNILKLLLSGQKVDIYSLNIFFADD